VQGLAVADTGTRLIERYYSLPRAPRDFVFLADGRIAVTGYHGHARGPMPGNSMLSVIDPIAGTVDSFVQVLAPFMNGLHRVGDRLYAHGAEGCTLRALSGDLRTVRWEKNLGDAWTGSECRFALDSNRVVFPAFRHAKAQIRFSALTDSAVGGFPDSVDIDTGLVARGEVALWGDHAFMLVPLPLQFPPDWMPGQSYPPREYKVAVVHLPSRTVEKFVFLQESDVSASRVENGIWYLYGRGVETFDLVNREAGQVLVPRQEHAIRYFVPTGPGRGYVVKDREGGRISWLEEVLF
jgi:hypothetical protein